MMLTKRGRGGERGYRAGAPKAHGRLVALPGASTLPATVVAGLRAAVGEVGRRGLRADDAVAARRCP